MFPFPWFILFQQFSVGVCRCFSDSFGRIFSKYCIVQRNNFNSFVLFGDFSFNIASTFSSIGFIPFSSISCPSHFVCFIQNFDFRLLARYRVFLACLEHQITFSRVLVYLRVLQLLCRLTMPVCSFLLFGLFFLEIS